MCTPRVFVQSFFSCCDGSEKAVIFYICILYEYTFFLLRLACTGSLRIEYLGNATAIMKLVLIGLPYTTLCRCTVPSLDNVSVFPP